MAEFKLDRFKYRWRGEWSSATSYRRDDVVRVGGKSYVCLITHTSDSSFRNDLNAILPGSSPPQPQPRWVVMTSGRTFRGTWQTATDYNLGDLIVYNGSIWLCETSHASTNFSSDIDNWTLFALHIDFVGNWISGSDYGPGALVKYGGDVYKCINAHQASSLLEDNIQDWEKYLEGIRYRGAWQQGTVYQRDDLVRYGGSVFRVTESHTSVTSFESGKFDLEFPGNQFDGEWSSITAYNVGDVVRYGGYLYYAVNNNIDSDPGREPDDSTIDWIVLAETYNFRGAWNIDTAYRTGDIVLRGGYLYIARRDVNVNVGDDSTLLYLDSEVWETLIPGKVFSAGWSSGIRYSLGEVVTYYGTAYVCNEEHVSTAENFPGDNGNGFEYWDILIQAGQPGGLLFKGDLLTYGLTRGSIGDGSTKADTRVPIGNQAEYLSVSDDLELFWRSVINDSDTVYVSPNGVDDEGFGTKYSPFKTVRYACEYIEDNFDPLTLTKVFVSTGRYEEIGPITIPAGCVVMGDELRSTTVVATSPIPEYANDYVYHQAALTRFTEILFDVLTGNPIEVSPGNTVSQNTQVAQTNLDAANATVGKLTDYQAFIEFRIQSGDTDPTVTGSNTLNSDGNFISASTNLLLNKSFIAEELYRYLVNEYPAVTFTRSRVRSDIFSLLRGLARDLKYSGNYLTLISARRYSNAVNGSQLDDLFYVRDVTGLRNMTTDGLQGSLNPPGVFAQYQRPTGGACVSLDPGWGPDDERTWIVNRSPYIQGVTNIGNSCVGKKVDGALHNGGNRSMVSNDFTQVLSDGVGAWVLNNARAELVSVFTYYCQVGYLAEDGGIIRATNGNNSYGSFGSIAEGNDPNETPQNVLVDNRNNEAQVESVFAGGGTDQIFAFEYKNCGEEYTSASADITGAGGSEELIFTDFRDGGLFEARLINTTGSGSEGGSNYLTRQANAQVTSAAQDRIVLNTSEATQFLSEIEDMRILIISGDGAGQYGYITGYDPVSKICEVTRESDGQRGWDHIISGTPIQSALDSTAVYRIEPRLEVNHPGFTSSTYNLPGVETFVDAAYGYTSAEYTNISVGDGTGEIFDAIRIAAEFNVDRNGPDYVVTLANTGAGYAVNDSFTITGDNLGGTTPANDLVITVTGTSDDSTNSITTFTSEGTPRGQRFVAIAQPNFALYSDDGENWTEVNLSFSGTYKKIIAAENCFIAIAENENRLSFSYNGQDWITRSLPATEKWTDIAYGDGRFVLIAEATNNAAYSDNGLTWSATTLPTGDDSTGDQWQVIEYGQGTFVALTGSQTRDVAVSTNGTSWTMINSALPLEDNDWVGLAYGGNKFLALSRQGNTVYSLDKGQTWISGTDAPVFGVPLEFNSFKYGDGVFLATGLQQGIGGTTDVATTEDGLVWRQESVSFAQSWSATTFGRIDNKGTWILLANDQTIGAVEHVQTGKRAKLRADIFQGLFQNIKIWDPGSGYDSVSNPLTISVYDNQFISEVETDNRIGNGVIAQPDFVQRGAGFRAATTQVAVTGDGFADIVPEANTLTLNNVNDVPDIGVQIRISTIPDETTEDPTDLRLFTGVAITDLGDDGTGNGTNRVQITISPSLRNEYNLAHGTAVTLRQNYSQCRISGHDFLDIGTGNFEQTNYPDLYAGGAFFTAAPENEVLEVDGGRVFYTSTDQDGNFRTGELFAVDQATGIVTISAEFFDLDGLSELALGGVRLGGSGAVVNEFSTDPTFAADSNNVVPTQRAIATFLADRLSVGGSDLETNALQAGQVKIGTLDDVIEVVSGQYLQIPRDVTFDGVDANGNPTEIQGTIVSHLFLYRDETDTMQ